MRMCFAMHQEMYTQGSYSSNDVAGLLLIVLGRYSDMSMKTVLSALPDYHGCLRPRCNGGQIHTEEDGPLFVCNTCGFRLCIHHKVPWHEGDTCKEYDYRTNGSLKRVEEQSSEKTKKDTTKPCPKCKAPIEKNDGCDHMRCKCGRKFNWSQAGKSRW